jgi:hypothetical protein
MSASSDFFSRGYFEARERFRRLAEKRSFSLERVVVASPRPGDSSDLSIDFAYAGPDRPKRLVVHVSGLHGVEGYTGSAIQCAALAGDVATGVDRGDDLGLLLAHAVNPYGMLNIRRANERSVDLNRNFFSAEAVRPKTPEAYRALERLMNPPTPHRFDFFLPRLLTQIPKFGFRNLFQFLACGQYEFDKGIFFGGRSLEPSSTALYEAIRRRSGRAETVIVIDVHTGLGRFGDDMIMVDPGVDDDRLNEIRSLYRTGVVRFAANREVRYEANGSFVGYVPKGLPGSRVLAVCQEFGTYKAPWMLKVIRDENRLHHWGDADKKFQTSNGVDVEHPLKQRMMEMFNPRSEAWRAKVISAGLRRLNQAFGRTA